MKIFTLVVLATANGFWDPEGQAVGTYNDNHAENAVGYSSSETAGKFFSLSATTGYDCIKFGDCVSSGNYPQSYPDRSECTISVLEDAQVILSDPFRIELGEDILTVAGVDIRSTEDFPDYLRSGDTISWASDSSIHYEGWEICFSSIDAALAKETQALLEKNAKLMEAIETAVGKKKRKRDSKESEDDQEEPEQPEEPEAPEEPEEMECKRFCKNNFSRNCRKKKDDCGGCQECSALPVSDSIQTAVNLDTFHYAVIFFATVGAFTIAYYISKAIFKMVNPNGFQAIKDIEI